MRNLNGKTWGQLTEEQRNELLNIANPVDGRTGDKPKKSGECIIDFGDYSINGRIIISEDEDIIEIGSEAVIYSPSL